MKVAEVTPTVPIDGRVIASQLGHQTSKTTRVEYNLTVGRVGASAVPQLPYCFTITPEILPDEERRHEAALLLQQAFSPQRRGGTCVR